MNAEHLQTAVTLMREINVMSLSTCAGDAPWAASVFFVADDALRLYFVSSGSSRHGENMLANSRAAATINRDHDNWLTIRGLQLEGQVGVVPASDRDRALSLYLDKFPAIAGLRDAPSSEQERKIVDRLMAADFYCLVPDWLRLIDNSAGFGFKAKLVPPFGK